MLYDVLSNVVIRLRLWILYVTDRAIDVLLFDYNW